METTKYKIKYKIKYKRPAKFTELGWKRFINKVHKEIDNQKLYHSVEDYSNERIDGFCKGTAHATKIFDKDWNQASYRAGIDLNGSIYVIFDYENYRRTIELYTIVTSEFVQLPKVPGADVDGDTALVVYM